MRSESEKKVLVQEQFSRTAQEYVTSAVHADTDALQEVVNVLAPKKTWTVLDIATGGGHVAKAVAPYVNHVVAADLTKTMLQTAKDYLQSASVHNVSYVMADAEQLPFLDRDFDAVTCRIAAHHFPNPKLFIQESARVLHPGGHFLLVDNIVPDDCELGDFYNELEQLRDISHVRCASVSEWTDWMQEEGLEITFAKEKIKTFQYDTWLKRMAKTQEQQERVGQWIRSADAKVKEFFRVNVENGEVHSFISIEWMALCVKR